MTTPSFSPDTLADLFVAIGVGEHAKRRGDAAPDVILLDGQGEPIRRVTDGLQVR